MIEFGVLYVDKTKPDYRPWKFYAFLDSHNSVYWDEDFNDWQTTNKLDLSLIEDDDFQKYQPKKTIQKYLIKFFFNFKG